MFAVLWGYNATDGPPKSIAGFMCSALNDSIYELDPKSKLRKTLQ